MNDFNYEDDLDGEQSEDKNAIIIAKRQKETEQKIGKRLRAITRKNPNQLSTDDKQFLKARASYLTKADREAFADVINASYVPEDEVKEEVPLIKLTRPILEAKAAELGIENPDDADIYPNKQSLVDAIEAAQ